MAQVSSLPNQPHRARDIPSSGLRVVPPMPVQLLKQGHMHLGTFSPVNQDGCFEFDRVIKSGQVLKRTRKTKSWGSVYLVLRPNLLSIYKNAEETKLRHQLNLSELTAVARQRDPKRKASHVFGVFSPARNFHFSGPTDRDAQDWVELIRREARIDEAEEEMFMLSLDDNNKEDDAVVAKRRANTRNSEVLLNYEPTSAPRDHGFSSYSSSEVELSAPPPKLHNSKHSRDHTSSSAKQQQQQRPPSVQRLSHLGYSGPDGGSYSDISDAGVVGMQHSTLSLSVPDPREVGGGGDAETRPVASVYVGSAPTMRRNASQMSSVGVAQDDERVVCQSWLHFLKSTRGMRQWKKAWVVLRPKNIAFYKNEEEYSATLILPFSSIIDAVDLDPISRRHPYCMQIIAEDRNYRFCAADEDALARWLGALKSLLAKRREASLLKTGSPK